MTEIWQYEKIIEWGDSPKYPSVVIRRKDDRFSYSDSYLLSTLQRYGIGTLKWNDSEFHPYLVLLFFKIVQKTHVIA